MCDIFLPEDVGKLFEGQHIGRYLFVLIHLNILGETALIHGATGACGLAAVQIASAVGKH